MYVKVTQHCIEQIQKRKPDKCKLWVIAIFRDMLKNYKNKTTILWHKVYNYSVWDWRLKILCWKYWFVYIVSKDKDRIGMGWIVAWNRA